MPNKVNPNRTVVAINSDAGAFTVIRLTTWAKYVEIDEDPSQNGGAKQGLQYNQLDPFAQSSNITHDASPTPPAYLTTPVTDLGVPEITIGDRYHVSAGTVLPLGNPGSGGHIDVPGGVATLGTPIVQVRTNTANATNVIVTEWA